MLRAMFEMELVKPPPGGPLELLEAGLGVPLFPHRAGSGPWARNRDVGRAVAST